MFLYLAVLRRGTGDNSDGPKQPFHHLFHKRWGGLYLLTKFSRDHTNHLCNTMYVQFKTKLLPFELLYSK